jgi:hypothetical protein
MNSGIYDTHDGEIKRIDKPLLNDTIVINYPEDTRHIQRNTDNYRNKSTCTTNTTNEYKEANRNAMNSEIYDTHDGKIIRIDKPLLNDTIVINYPEDARTQHAQRQDTHCTDDTNIVIMDKPRLNDGSAQEQQCHHHNTHNTDNQADHDAPTYATHKPHTNHPIDNEQDTHPQHTDKIDAHLRCPQALDEPEKC